MVMSPTEFGAQAALTWKEGGTRVGVGVGDRQNMEPVATTVLVVSSTSKVRVPNSPLVLILKDCPELSWKVFWAIGVPFRLTRQVKGVVISPPVLVMVMSPTEFGAQAALTWKEGGTRVGVGVGDRQNIEPVATTLLEGSSTSKVRVPNSPLVLILKDCPELSWKVFWAIGVPFRLIRQVKGVAISPPVLVMVMSPTEFGAQAALTWKEGGTRVGVGVGDRQNMEPVATTVLVVSSTSNVRVPNSPLVFILKDCPELSWKVFWAIGVPFKLMRQV